MERFKVLVLGAGTGGLAVAARLLREDPALKLALVDAADTHYFQPHWTLAGAGLVAKAKTARPTAELLPEGAEWIRRNVARVEPRANTVWLDDGRALAFEKLIVATGLRIAWEKIGGDGRYVSIYDFGKLENVWRELREFNGGTALFVMPPVPIKCAGAPQKIMYLAEEIFRRQGVRAKTRILFAVAGPSMFSIPLFAKTLTELAHARGIECLFNHQLIATENGIAVFANGARIAYDFLHAVPPMENHLYLKDSGLCDASGWLEVDKGTLQSTTFKNIYGVGDCTGVPNSKTAAAAVRQAAVVAANLREEATAKYDGYSACPIVTEKGKVLLAEFGYGGQLLPTLPLEPTRPRRLLWFYYRYFYPWLYWHSQLRGR